jgi:transcriptional regulator with XRE-family HTH domain
MTTNPPPNPKISMWTWLAYSLRFHRMQRGLSGEALGRILTCSKATVSRLESGEARLDDKQAAALDRAWDTGGHFSIMLWYARLGHDPDWLKQYVDIEARADVIKPYEAIVVPGLLQIPEYARALLTSGGVLDVDGAVERRMARQAILERDPPPVLWVLLSEGVLDWPVGGTEVMRRQLARLLEASESPNIGIRVVPRSAGAHAGADGSFMIMSGDFGDVAYSESQGGGRLVPSPAEVRSYQIWYDRIGQQALPEGSSRDLIKQVMEAMT